MKCIEFSSWRYGLFNTDLVDVSDDTDPSLNGTFNTWDPSFFHALLSFFDTPELGTEITANNRENGPDWEEDTSVQWRCILANIIPSIIMGKLQSISGLPQ